MFTMELFFWAGLIGATYSYLLYPLVLLLLPKRRDPRLASLSNTPSVAIIIAARDEHARIGDKLDNTLDVNYPKEELDIVVASDASSDGTDDIVDQFAANGVRLIRSDERRGKEYAQLLAVNATNAEIVVFTDVGTRIARDGIAQIVNSFCDPMVGAVSSEDRFQSRDGSAVGEGAYVKYEMWLRRVESAVHGLVGLSGSFFAVRRELCQDWDTGSPSDFNAALNCARKGYRAVTNPRVIGFYQDILDPDQAYQRKVRTVLRGITAVVRQWRVLNPLAFGFFSFQMWSHKVMRWLVPWFLILLLISSSALADQHWFYMTAAALQGGIYCLALAAIMVKSLKCNPLFKIPLSFIQANVAAAHATVAFFSGKRITAWDPSRR